MKRLMMVMACGLCLFGCASSTEPIEDDVLVDATESDLAEQERQAHIDEIRKSINGEQEEMTTEEYFEQQREQERKEKSQEAIASAHNWREYNDIIVHGFGDLTEQKEETKEPQKEEVKEEPKVEITLAQRNAVREAENYLSFAPFSRVGLIDQLEYEGYSNEDATYAVDHVKVDWNEQCAKSAEHYLDFMAFSRDGLHDQLEYEGFTEEQIQYGLQAVGY